MTVHEIVAVEARQPMTIVAATKSDGIDRAKAERILDPRGFFAKNKRGLKHRTNVAR